MNEGVRRLRGGQIEVYDKTGEGIVTLDADDYGNGEVRV